VAAELYLLSQETNASEKSVEAQFPESQMVTETPVSATVTPSQIGLPHSLQVRPMYSIEQKLTGSRQLVVPLAQPKPSQQEHCVQRDESQLSVELQVTALV